MEYNKEHARYTYFCPPLRGMQIFHSRQADIRYQEHLLMTQGVDALEAVKIVAQ